MEHEAYMREALALARDPLKMRYPSEMSKTP